MQWYINDQGKEYIALICDKCGQQVPGHNSAINLEEQMGHFVGICLDRHLYPTDDCPGSPSRVKLIESDFQYRQAYEAIGSFKLKMNLHKSPELVKQSLIEMGDYPSNERESRCGNFPKPNSGYSLEDAEEWLSSREKDNADTFVIYGRSEFHRYIVNKNGEVFFSGLHGGDCVEKAVLLGFGIDN
ncbi:hypothetical protein NIES2111_56270 (plasmid) [Nostoc sp. NIES-2111]|nr:hypothetical protein NIES2111_56270 [Nostoc sp. NIES-2111]